MDRYCIVLFQNREELRKTFNAQDKSKQNITKLIPFKIHLLLPNTSAGDLLDFSGREERTIVQMMLAVFAVYAVALAGSGRKISTLLGDGFWLRLPSFIWLPFA